MSAAENAPHGSPRRPGSASSRLDRPLPQFLGADAVPDLKEATNRRPRDLRGAQAPDIGGSQLACQPTASWRLTAKQTGRGPDATTSGLSATTGRRHAIAHRALVFATSAPARAGRRLTLMASCAPVRARATTPRRNSRQNASVPTSPTSRPMVSRRPVSWRAWAITTHVRAHAPAVADPPELGVDEQIPAAPRPLGRLVRSDGVEGDDGVCDRLRHLAAGSVSA